MTKPDFYALNSSTFPHFIALFLLGVWAPSANLHASDSEFRTYKLPDSISIKLPSSWKIIGGKTGTAIEEGVKAAMDEAGVASKEVILLNAVSDASPLSSGVSVTLLRDKDARVDHAVRVTDETLKMLDAKWKSNMAGILHAQGQRLLAWNGTRREKLDERTVLTSEFLRSSHGSPDSVFCQQAVYFGSKRIVIISVWCADKELAIWKPLFQRIKKSASIP